MKRDQGASPDSWPVWLAGRDGELLVLQIWVQPGASKTSVVGIHGDRLKVKIAAPPVDGKANDHLCAFFAAILKIPKSQVSLVRGDTARQKTLSVKGVAASLLLSVLAVGSSSP